MNKTDQPERIGYPDDEINLLNLLLVVLSRRKMIIIVTIVATALAIVFSLLMPDMYQATTRILPPPESNMGMQSQLPGMGALSLLSGSMIGGSTAADLYIGILKSRTVADGLIYKFNLKKLYDLEFMENTVLQLEERSAIELSIESHIISISVEDEDAGRAAEMANTYLEFLDHINRTVNTSEAHRKRVFLEKRIEGARDDLLRAETNLKVFQEKHKVVAIHEQARVTIEGAANIKGEIIAAEIELQVLKQFGTENQNEAVMLKTKIAELKNQLTEIELGNPEKNEDNAYIPFKELPSLGMELGRLIRNAKIQAEIFKLLTNQHEMAEIEEAKDINTIQILDIAVPPDKKSGPNRRLIVLLAVCGGFFIAVLLAFFLEFLDRLKADDPERYQQLIQGFRLRRPK